MSPSQGKRQLHLPQLWSPAQAHLRLPHGPGRGRRGVWDRKRLPGSGSDPQRGGDWGQEDQEGARVQRLYPERVWTPEIVQRGDEEGKSKEF